MDALSAPWPAPAKLNRFLHVTGRRADGYHLLQTAFQFVERCDWLWFEPHPDARIELAQPLPGVPVETDLSVRAAHLLREASGRVRGVTIHVEKHVPIGGGLGGGSSDAATTLAALNALWGCGLGEDALAALGLRLGADVPVFVRGRAAWAEGVGEVLTPVELDQPWFVVVVPACAVPTAIVFADPDLTRDTPPITIRAFRAGQGGNDCEAVVYRRFPPVARAAEWLSGFTRARLTGTGACVFGAFERREGAEAALKAMPEGMRGFVTRGLNRSPLLDRLDDAADREESADWS